MPASLAPLPLPSLPPLPIPRLQINNPSLDLEREQAKSRHRQFTNKTKMLPISTTTSRHQFSTPSPLPATVMRTDSCALGVSEPPTLSTSSLPPEYHLLLEETQPTPRTEPIPKPNPSQLPPPPSTSTTPTSPRLTTSPNSNPIYTLIQIAEITRLTESVIPKENFLSPQRAFDVWSVKNRSVSDKVRVEDIHESGEHGSGMMGGCFLLDVRSQSEMAFHLVDGKPNTFIRGAIPFPLEQMTKWHKSSPTHGEKNTYLPAPLDEPSPDGGLDNHDFIISCTDGRKSVLTWDYFVNTIGVECARVFIVSGGVRNWSAGGKLPVTVVKVEVGGVSSDDSENDVIVKRE